MGKISKKKILLSSVIILGFLTVLLIPFVYQTNQPLLPTNPYAPANTETPTLIESKQNPSSVNLWWNYSWNYRRQINVREPGYVSRINDIAKVHLTFTNGHCYNNSIRVLYYHPYTHDWVEVPIQLENVTYHSPPNDNYIDECDLMFLYNVTRRRTSTYYVYYNDTYTGAPPTYATPLNINIVGTSYFTFETGVISGNYTIRYSGTGIDDDACFRIFKVNGVDIIPTSEMHSGIDRIEGDDPGRVSGNLLNWTAELIEDGPIRAIVRVSKLSTDEFASSIGGGTYGPTNKTYTFYAYQGYVSVSVNSVTSNLPVYDFAAVNITNQWRLYIDTYDLGVATDYPWTDLLSSPQPYNYISLVRNDGIGLSLIGSPKWPYDIYEAENRTSMEYGFGTVDPGVFSFFLRNDGRDPNEYNISVPFRYNIMGLTDGFSQVRDTWYQVNQPVSVYRYGEVAVFYPLTVRVTDNFNNAIPRAVVNIYNDPALSQLYTSRTTNSQGRYTFLLNKNYTADQYWIQSRVTVYYAQVTTYLSDAIRWNPILNFTYDSSTLTIKMNITTVYVEVWDNSSHRVQNADVTLNYIDSSITDISQNVDPFYANCIFYAYANEQLNIDVYLSGVPKEISKIYELYPSGAIKADVTPPPPLNINEPKRYRVEINENIQALPTELSSNVTILNNIYWKDNVTFNVWLKTGEIPISAESINFTIYNSTGDVMAGPTPMDPIQVGLYYRTFNTSTIGQGLLAGDTYTITITATTNSSYLNPTPISIFLPVQNLPVEAFSVYGINNPIEVEWYEPLSDFVSISIRLTDVHNNLRVDGANVSYTITNTTYVNEPMQPAGNPGWYEVNDSVVDDLRPGNYIVTIESSLQNYTIPSKSIRLIINFAPTKTIVPSTDIQGAFDEDIPVYVQFLRPGEPPTNDTPIIGATVFWRIQGTNATGGMTDPSNTGNYSGQIPSGTVPSGTYVLIIQATKENYNFTRIYLGLDIRGAPTAFTSAILVPQLFGSSEFLFAGPLVQVENSWFLAPISFTYVDSQGNPVPNASISITGGFPVIGEKGVGGIGGSQVHSLQLGAGDYMVFVPIFGLPPSTLLLNIVCQATNYQTQQITMVVSIKEKAIPFGPFRVPVSLFFVIVAAVAIPTALFGSYTYIKRARLPYAIKRIDELIRAIGRGEKVTVKHLTREKITSGLLRDELALVGVEPRLERYIPVELADLIVPLLVESGMEEKEAYAMSLELKTATPSDREKLLESVGIPGESSARIIQTIEEYEEKRAPFRKSYWEILEELSEEPEELEEEPEEDLEPDDLF